MGNSLAVVCLFGVISAASALRAQDDRPKFEVYGSYNYVRFNEFWATRAVIGQRIPPGREQRFPIFLGRGPSFGAGPSRPLCRFFSKAL